MFMVPVYMRFCKQRVITQRAAYVQIIAHSVALDIGFVYDVEAVSVRTVHRNVPAAGMAGTDCVYVVPLPKFEIFQHKLFGNVTVVVEVFIMLLNN